MRSVNTQVFTTVITEYTVWTLTSSPPWSLSTPLWTLTSSPPWSLSTPFNVRQSFLVSPLLAAISSCQYMHSLEFIRPLTPIIVRAGASKTSFEYSRATPGSPTFSVEPRCWWPLHCHRWTVAVQQFCHNSIIHVDQVVSRYAAQCTQITAERRCC